MNHKTLGCLLLITLFAGCEHKQAMQSPDPLPDDRMVVKIQEYLMQPGRAPIAYLHILGLDERDATGALGPDNRIDLDPAILDLQRGELIFPDLRPFAPAGIFLDQGMPQILLPRDQYVSAMYDTNSVSAIAFSSKFYIEVKYQASN